MTGGGIFPPREWRLHLGVHKTATTHLQAMLDALRPELAARGVDVVTHETLSSGRIPDLRRRNPGAWLGGAVLRRDLLRKLAPHLTGQPRLVLSHEDWIGPSQDALEPEIYPRAGFRLRALFSALPRGAHCEVFVSVRSPDALLPAAYATALKFRAYPFRFDDIRARLVQSPPDWDNLIGRIAAVLPRNAGLAVWPYELYRSHARGILSLVAGQEVAAVPEIGDPISTRTPGAAAVRAAEALDPGLPYAERLRRTRDIYEAVGQDGEKFAPFTPEETARLRDAYAAQFGRLAARPGVRLLGAADLEAMAARPPG